MPLFSHMQNAGFIPNAAQFKQGGLIYKRLIIQNMQPAFCICKNKGANQLHGDHDQRPLFLLNRQ